jgi:GNAT superfamily N-acetyltransferase
MTSIIVSDIVVHIAPARLADIVDLRHAVLRQGLPREAAIFDGDNADTTHHFAAMAEGKCLGCATFHLNQWQGDVAWQLRGMATDPKFRGQGIGAKLLQLAEDTLKRSSPVRQLWCNARTPAIEFYKKQGWKIVSEEFEIPTAGPHFRMTKLLP